MTQPMHFAEYADAAARTADEDELIQRTQGRVITRLRDQDGFFFYNGTSWEDLGNPNTAEVDDGNSSTADTIDWSAGEIHKSTMTGACTYTFTAPVAARAALILKLVQDGTGSRLATWPAAVVWAGGRVPLLSTAAAAVDVIRFAWNGTNYYGELIGREDVAHIDDGNSGTADTIDWSAGKVHKSTLDDAVTYTFTAPLGPKDGLILKAVQDATGSRLATWPATVLWAGGSAPTLTTTGSATDVLRFAWDGTNYFGEVVALDVS